MPLRHGLNVSVISTELEKFTEYGVDTRSRSKLVTAKIEAKTGVHFQIAIRPEYPFPTEQSKKRGSSILAGRQSGFHSDNSYEEKPSTPRKRKREANVSVLDTSSAGEDQRKEAHHDKVNDDLKPRSTHFKKSEPGLPLSVSSESSNPNALSESAGNPNPIPPPFDLIVEVFIDGRTKAEIRSALYLNPSNPYYSPADVILKGRRVWAPSRRGEPMRSCIYDWVFTDVGIEVLFERMDVEDTIDDVGKETGGDPEVAGLANLLQNTANVASQDEEDQELKIGKIEVVFNRAILGSSGCPTGAPRDLNDPEEAQTAPQKAIGKDVTHTTSVLPPIIRPSSSSTSPGSTIRQPIFHKNLCRNWTHYNPAEDFYAKFSFDYTSRAKLVKWGLCDETGTPIATPRGPRNQVAGGVDVGVAQERSTVLRLKDKTKESRKEAERDETMEDLRGGGEGEMENRTENMLAPPKDRAMTFTEFAKGRGKETEDGRRRPAKRTFDTATEGEGEEGEVGEEGGEGGGLVGAGEDGRARLRPRVRK